MRTAVGGARRPLLLRLLFPLLWSAGTAGAARGRKPKGRGSAEADLHYYVLNMDESNDRLAFMKQQARSPPASTQSCSLPLVHTARAPH